MPNRSRDRQLAKLAARRQAERRRAKRRRGLALGTIGAAMAVALVVVGVMTLTRNDEEATASPTASPTTRPSGKPHEPRVTGTVEPTVRPPTKVACAAAAPPEAGKPKPQFSGPPSTDILNKRTEYAALVTTSCGTIELQLDAKASPKTVASFVFLARHGFFDGLTFHRVVPGFVIQSGDPLGSGQGGPGYSIPDEYTGSDHYGVGVLAMANANRPDEGVTNTGGSQFFIVSGKEGENLDATPNYTVFGSVTKGLDVVKRIDSVPVGGPNGDTPEQAVYVETIAIKERAKPASAPSPTVSASPSS